MELKAKFFDQLSTQELYEILRARAEIFLLEQRIICQDMDGVDHHSLHCFLEQDGKVLAYLRAFPTQDGAVQIGRVLSVTHGIGLGKALMQRALPVIRETYRCHRFTMHAQKQALGFYEKLGFYVTSPEFLEEGVPHVSMEFILQQGDLQ